MGAAAQRARQARDRTECTARADMALQPQGVAAKARASVTPVASRSVRCVGFNRTHGRGDSEQLDTRCLIALSWRAM